MKTALVVVASIIGSGLLFILLMFIVLMLIFPDFFANPFAEIETGMTELDVIEILGEPGKRMTFEEMCSAGGRTQGNVTLCTEIEPDGAASYLVYNLEPDWFCAAGLDHDGKIVVAECRGT